MVFLTGASPQLGGPSRCSTLRWCLKNDTSLAVVSIRSTSPAHRVKPGGMLIIHLDRCLAEVVLHADAFDPGREPGTNLLVQLWRDPVAEVRRNLLGLHVQHRLAEELLVERAEGAGRAECEVGGVFHLHQAPVILNPAVDSSICKPSP